MMKLIIELDQKETSKKAIIKALRTLANRLEDGELVVDDETDLLKIVEVYLPEHKKIGVRLVCFDELQPASGVGVNPFKYKNRVGVNPFEYKNRVGVNPFEYKKTGSAVADYRSAVANYLYAAQQVSSSQFIHKKDPGTDYLDQLRTSGQFADEDEFTPEELAESEAAYQEYLSGRDPGEPLAKVRRELLEHE